MVVKSSGRLSMENDIVNEFGGNRPHSLSEYYRGGAFVPNVSQNNRIPSTPNTRIAFSDFYGTVKLFSFTINENVREINLRTYLLARGWDGSSPVQLTLAANRYLWSDNVSVPAVTTGSFPSGLTFIVNGFIMGKGGKGGDGRTGFQNGQNGGPAISLSASTALIVNGGFIGGGGGGGGATGIRVESGAESVGAGGGGGAGGGEGGDAYSLFSDGSVEFIISGGAGGAIGQSGSNGQSDGAAIGGDGGTAGGAGSVVIQQDKESDDIGGGGGGGRVFPGVGGTGQQGAGSGGSGASSGANGVSGGGGGWGRAGGNGNGGQGGLGGPSIIRNGFGLTLSGNSGTIYGAIT